MRPPQQGSALIVGLLLLAVVSLLGLAAGSAAHVELLLARNERFRENAANAASAGLEIALRRIVTASSPSTVPPQFSASLPGTADTCDVQLRWLGLEAGLPQAPGASLAGAHFEIIATGRSGRRALDRQRARVRWVVEAPETAEHGDCEPLAPGVRCLRAGELHRLSWQRLPAP